MYPNALCNAKKFFLHVAGVLTLSISLFASGTMSEPGNERYTVPLTDPARPASVKVGLLAGSITVKGYDGKEVIVEAHVRGSEEAPRGNASGMKRIPMTGTGLSAEEQDNHVRISVETFNKTTDLTITVPYRTSLNLSTVNDGDIMVNGVEGEFDISNNNGNVKLLDISGSVVCHALNGRMMVKFRAINNSKPMAFSSLNGDIDVTFPADLKATLILSNNQGEVLTDFEYQMAQSTPETVVEDGREKGGKYRVKTGTKSKYTINGGGQEITIKNFNGNIYIRKAGAKS